MLSLLRRVSVAMAEDQARKYSSGTHSVVLVTHDDMSKAKTLAGKIVKERIAACVNIVPKITSVYEWEGKINEDEELMMVIKTETAKVDELTTFVRENHPYDVPEVIAMKLVAKYVGKDVEISNTDSEIDAADQKIDNGNPAYLDWITDTVSAKKHPSQSDSAS